MRRKLRSLAGSLERTDSWLLAAVGGMLFLGIFVVYGAGSFNRQALYSPLGQHFIIAKHLAMIGVGLLAMLGLMNLDYRRFRRRWLNWGGLAVSMVLVAVTVVNRGGQDISRWITVMGFSFQPVEMGKICLVMFLAERLSGRGGGARPSAGSLAVTAALGPLPMLLLLLLQPNYGNAMVVVGMTVIILLVADVPARVRVAVLTAPPAAGVLIYLISGKVRDRFAGLLGGLLQGDYCYQVKQSLTGLGAGGWRGLGVGQSHNKFAFLPESHTDFAFSLLGEEWGLLGTLPVIFMLGLFVWRGYGIAARAVDNFGKLAAAGLTTAIAIYGIANIGMVTGIFPVIGVPLPFISFGGTAMIGSLAIVGILLNIEKTSRSHLLWKRRWERSGTS